LHDSLNVKLIIFQALPKLKCIERIQDPRYKKWTKQFFWILSISRNALVVMASATLAFFLSDNKEVIQLDILKS